MRHDSSRAGSLRHGLHPPDSHTGSPREQPVRRSTEMQLLRTLDLAQHSAQLEIRDRGGPTQRHLSTVRVSTCVCPVCLVLGNYSKAVDSAPGLQMTHCSCRPTPHPHIFATYLYKDFWLFDKVNFGLPRCRLTTTILLSFEDGHPMPPSRRWGVRTLYV